MQKLPFTCFDQTPHSNSDDGANGDVKNDLGKLIPVNCSYHILLFDDFQCPYPVALVALLQIISDLIGAGAVALRANFYLLPG